MANLNESDLWEPGIYQLEEDDPVLGGPTGIDNLAPRQLASRSRYQRLRNITPWVADFPYPAEAYVSDAGFTWKSLSASTGVQPGTDGTKWVRWGHTATELAAALGNAVAAHEAKPDPHTQYVWVNGDTMTGPLNVPAGAVGTQVPRVQEVVKKSGDAMAGSLELVTPAQFDSSTKAASTFHVQRALGSYSGTRDIAAAGTVILGPGDAGKYISVSAANVAVVLPLGADVIAGTAFVIGPAQRCLLQRSGQDGLATPAGNVVTYVALYSPTVVVWRGDVWHVIELPMGGDADVGTVFYTARSSPPPGSVKANFAALSRTTYSRLFSVIGTSYGAGDGATTFNVPDGRGVFLRGFDDGRNVDTSRVLATLQEGTWIRTLAQEWSGSDTAAGGPFAIGTPYANPDQTISSIGGPGGTVPGFARAAGGAAWQAAASDNFVKATAEVDPAVTNNWIRMRPINLALMACIKY